MSYPIVTVPSGTASQLEQLGTKSKFWYRHPGTSLSLLFKEGRPGTGENWAEKVCCEICVLLGLSHAVYELAEWDGNDGVITPSFVPEFGRLIHGNELLGKIVDDYDDGKRYQSKQHTVKRVIAVTGSGVIGPPLDWILPSQLGLASDVFVGYLMLDALVGNQDRHHENWGVVTSAQGFHLAPTFDHASSLGRNESDTNRLDRLTTRDKGRDVEAFAKRARSAFFETPSSSKTMSTIDAFREGAKLSPKGGRYWLDKLENISHENYEEIFSRIPNSLITKPGIDFALKMLEVNSKRLLDNGS